MRRQGTDEDILIEDVVGAGPVARAKGNGLGSAGSRSYDAVHRT